MIMRKTQEIEIDISSLNNAILTFNSSIDTVKSKLKSNNDLLINITNEINSVAASTFLYDYLKEANQELINKLNTLSVKIDSVSNIVNDKVYLMMKSLYDEKNIINKINASIIEDGVDNNG